MTKVYELPNDHRMIADIDETTRICTITETQLDSLISKLNYYAEGQDEVLGKISAEIIWYRDNKLSYEANSETIELTNYYLTIIDKYKAEESEE